MTDRQLKAYIKWCQHIIDQDNVYPPSMGGGVEDWEEVLQEHKANGCLICKRYRIARKNWDRRNWKKEIAESLGLVAVKGAVSGRTYYE